MRPPRSLPRRFGLLAAAALAVAGCQRSQEPPDTAPAPAAPRAPVLVTPPMPQAVVSRTELLEALDAAGSAYAAGGVDEGPDLAGRRFAVRQAFGCSGPAPLGGAAEAGLASWAWGPRNETIALSLTPADWKSSGALGAAAAHWEAVEGFWLDRPWLRVGGCPVPGIAETPAEGAAPGALAPAAPATPSRQTAGLAAVFEEEGSRVGRRGGKAFTHTLRGAGGQMTAPAAGYRLVIEGRFTVFPGQRTIQCRAAAANERPVCIAAAHVDRMAFESADGELLSEWRAG